MAAWAGILVVLVCAAAVTSQEGGATFWSDRVTLTCPEEGKWFDSADNKKAINDQIEKTYEFQFKHKAQYRCDYGNNEQYLFYVKGKACRDCFEVDGLLFLLVIVVDVIVTMFLMWMVFRCSSKRSSAAPPPARSPAGRAPAPTDYQTLNPKTVSVQTYSTVRPKTK